MAANTSRLFDGVHPGSARSDQIDISTGWPVFSATGEDPFLHRLFDLSDWGTERSVRVKRRLSFIGAPERAACVDDFRSAGCPAVCSSPATLQGGD
jgi:hypothetical protein